MHPSALNQSAYLPTSYEEEKRGGGGGGGGGARRSTPHEELRNTLKVSDRSLLDILHNTATGRLVVQRS